MAELAQPAQRQLRADLDLPPVHSRFFESQVFWLMGDGQSHRVQGRDVYLMDLALGALYRAQPAAGVLAWLYDHALEHGWVASADRHAFAQEVQVALDTGSARPGMGWDRVISFLRSGTGDIVTSLSIGTTYPDSQLALDSGAWQPAVTDPAGSEDELEGLWDQLSGDEQWDLCAQALQACPSRQWRLGGERYLFGDTTIRPPAGPGTTSDDG